MSLLHIGWGHYSFFQKQYLLYNIKMKYRFSSILCMSLLMSAVVSSCGGGDDDPIINPTPSPTPTPTPTPTGMYHELYRPQIHYTPARNWVNDPNGMVYVNGVWHLFYQYNPYGNNWGNMSWGHATSKDLVHWEEQATALYRDELGDIFSGSAVIDKDNTAGFGANAVIALYTSAGDHQQQSLAYSTDNGMTFKTYAGNPIIANNDRPDFRDPKVFWHEDSKQWVMTLALGNKWGIDIWTSRDLRSWKYESTFTTDIVRCHNCQWECPDLIQLPVEGTGETKWVLIVNVNPGGPTGGSGTMCFIGDFDGKTFTADDLDYPMWMDYGMDNYAGVTWSNAPEGRKVFIGWMNNWLYSGNVPCDPWRSAFTLPRDLSLVNIGGKPYIASRVSKEVEKAAGSWQNLPADGSVGNPSAYHLQVTIPLDTNVTFSLANEKNENLEFSTNTIYHTLSAKRTSATGVSVSSFSFPSVSGKILGNDNTLTLDIYVDQSSVEVFSADGTFVMTNLVFPSSIYNKAVLPSSATNARYQVFESIWK